MAKFNVNFRVLGIASLTAGLALVNFACEAPTGGLGAAAASASGAAGGTAGNGSGGGGAGGGAAPAANAPVAITAVMLQKMNLGTTLTVPVTIQSANGYSGPVTLSIDNKVLAANDLVPATITATIAPESVDVTEGGTAAQATVTLTTQSSSPDLTSFVNVVATTTNSGQGTGQVPLQILPIFEVDIISGFGLSTANSEMWSIAAGATTKFTTHKSGITLNFVNKDPKDTTTGYYRIHSNAQAFLHQPTVGMGLMGTSTPSSMVAGKDAGTEAISAGATYTVTVTDQTSQLTNIYYDHNHQSQSEVGGVDRTMIFNAFEAPTPIGNSGNPNASYAYLNANLFNSATATYSCKACHITNVANGANVNLGTYTNVLMQVLKGSPEDSALYFNVALGTSVPAGNGSMPQAASGGAAPGPVPAAMIQALSDWISDGALDN